MKAHFENPLEGTEQILEGLTRIVRIRAETGWEKEVLEQPAPRVHERSNAMPVPLAVPDLLEYLQPLGR